MRHAGAGMSCIQSGGGIAPCPNHCLACPPAANARTPTPPLPNRTEPLLPRVASLVRDCMEGAAAAVRLRVPLRVRLAAGPSWGQLAEVQLPPSQHA